MRCESAGTPAATFEQRPCTPACTSRTTSWQSWPGAEQRGLLEMEQRCYRNLNSKLQSVQYSLLLLLLLLLHHQCSHQESQTFFSPPPTPTPTTDNDDERASPTKKKTPTRKTQSREKTEKKHRHAHTKANTCAFANTHSNKYYPARTEGQPQPQTQTKSRYPGTPPRDRETELVSVYLPSTEGSTQLDNKSRQQHTHKTQPCKTQG